MRYRLSFIVAIVFAGILHFVHCQRNTADSGSVVAFVVKTLNHPFFIDMERGAREAAGEAGVHLIVQGPEREVDVEKQMQIVENLIQRRVNALCVAPCGSREIVPAVVKANRAGIPVIAVDTRVDAEALQEAGGTVVSFIGSDNYQGGRLAGEFIAERLNGRGRVALLEGIPGHETGDARRRGFYAALEGTGIEVAAALTANWERDQGFNVFQNILQANPDIEALFACNDLMALGAIEAIDVAGKTGRVLVVGFDALEDAKQAIRDGRMAGSVAQHPYRMGRLAVMQAARVLKGEEVEAYVPVDIGLVTESSLR